MSASTKIAVAGATGRIGRHVVDVLREQGPDVQVAGTSGLASVTVRAHTEL